MARIVVDPGHGGWQTIPNDSSWNNAVGPNGTLEKNLTLDIGLRVHQLLHAGGHQVQLTRDHDVNLRLRDRAKVARDARAHAFVSIHFNGSQNHNAQGTETLVHTNYSSRSAQLSLLVQDEVLSVTGLTDRNRAFDQATRIKPQSLGVLRPQHHHPDTASCLVEVSFLDRSDEEARLQQESYKQNIAKAIAKGIEAFTSQTLVVSLHEVVEVGDAIELAAVEALGEPDVASLLDLSLSSLEKAEAPEKATADTEEIVQRPSGTFSKAFLENAGPPLALIAGDAPWPDLGDFLEFFKKLKLQHFTADEILYLGASNASGKCKGKNAFPPRNIWKNIANTAEMIDSIRKEMGAPIRILSCYRSPEYNTCVKGESNSLHVQFNAIDFTCAQGTPEIWRRIADKLRAGEKKFVGGIGVYPTRAFVHIDTRGKVADWVG